MLRPRIITVLLLAMILCVVHGNFQTKNLVSSPLDDNVAKDRFFKNSWSTKQMDLGPIKPESAAQEFQIWTLNNGLVVYPGPKLAKDVPIGFHAFTNNSGFLESMWTNTKSLVDFVNTSPESAHYVFMTFDDNALETVSWMRNQLINALSQSKLADKEQDFLSRCFFVITPVFEIGNWISSILSDWSCTDHGCGLNQVMFYSEKWQPQILVSKRVDARYDWVFTHQWSPNSLNLLHISSSLCNDFSLVLEDINGSVILIPDDSRNCSIAKQVYVLQSAGAAGVLVYSKPGFPLQDLNCAGDDCDNVINIPVASIAYNAKLISTLSSQQVVKVSLQTTPSPNFYFTINTRGEVVEPGWFLYPSLQFFAWQMQWLVFDDNLMKQISQLDDYVVTVFNHTVMQGKNGTGSVSIMFSDLSQYSNLYLDAALSCESDRDEGCPPWDHTPQLYVCCEGAPLCDVEIGRWITSFRRGIGHWLTDISPLLPLLAPSSSTSKCSFVMKMGSWWAQPWVSTLILRFQKPRIARPSVSLNMQNLPQTTPVMPFRIIKLFEGGTFDKTYNSKYHPITFVVPSDAVVVRVYAVITGHGSDNNGCGEFCVTTHNFVVNGKYKHTTTFDNAGTPLGCADRVPEGVVPNEHGTWLYGRDGWCDGQQVNPWVFDITSQLDLHSNNTIVYSGLFNGTDPNPTENPGVIIMSSYLVYYRKASV